MDNKDLPAFPDPRRGAAQTFCNQTPEKEPAGLTKREYFAARIMQALISSWGQHDVTDYGELASDAVLAADKLLAELNKQPAPTT